MAGPAVDAVYRAEFGRALATVARLVGDIAAAEDAVQEAFAEALRTWPARGTPANPGAWITTVARHPGAARGGGRSVAVLVGLVTGQHHAAHQRDQFVDGDRH
ncbi:sigma factor, partial [Nocardia farcinica]|uniref:sigma factor n=1 Tax=Nocardia farcinica TaxID=37329 RepID=UPI002456B953